MKGSSKMTRNLKAIGLALCAAFAMSAVAAASASAVEDHITSSASTTNLSVASNTPQKFFATTNNAEEFIECKKVSVSGSLPSTTNTEVTVKPQYDECMAHKPGVTVSATVTDTEKNCHYTFKGLTQESVTPGEHATVNLDCDGTTGIEVHLTAFKFKCIAVQDQSLVGVKYANAANGDVKLTATVHGIQSETISSTACSAGEHNDGLYTGEVTVAGKDTAGNDANLSVTET